MPQLDFSVFPSQLFWLLLSFFSMLFIMSKFIIPKTAEMINLRKEKVEGDLAKAAEIRQKMEKSLIKYNQALQQATMKANESLQKTRDELNDTINSRQADLDARLRTEVEVGEKRISASKKKTLCQIEEVSAELAIDVLHSLGFVGIKTKDALNALEAMKRD
jgi:F-type H+-transporting ATPase subunit b